MSATHGTAQLALFDQSMRNKYDLASIAGTKYQSDTLAAVSPRPQPSRIRKIPQACSDRTAIPFRRYGCPVSSSSPLTMRSGARRNAHRLRAKSGCHTRLLPRNLPITLSKRSFSLTPGMAATIAELQQAEFHPATTEDGGQGMNWAMLQSMRYPRADRCQPRSTRYRLPPTRPAQARSNRAVRDHVRFP
jgi:hypothetical protein